MTTSPLPTDAEKLVAEWRAAMEGVTPGPWRPSRYGFQVVSDYPEPAWQSVVELTTIARSEPNVEREMLTQKAIASWLARCSPSGISGLLALIESQRATIERVERERDDLQERFDQLHAVKDIQAEKRHEAEARVTDLEGIVSECQGVLAMMTAPDAIKQTTVINAYAAAIAAETRARTSLSSTEKTDER